MTKRLFAMCSLLLSFALVAFASDYEKKTVITLNEPVIVAGVQTVTLQPGTYVLRLMNHASNRNIVEIFNEREDHLYALVLAIPNYRLDPKDKTELRFWETPEGNPVALRAWFFPGDRWGQEFVYPKGLAARIARQTGGPVLAEPQAETEAELTQAPVTEINKAGEEQPIEFDQYTLDEIAGANPPAEEATPLIALALVPQEPAAPAPAEAPLPATASPYFLLATAGFLSAATGFGLKQGSRDHARITR
jgi:hypothetical protein